jgi:hypothetical protein
MCSPAIGFIIFKISHVFTWYRSIAGKHIKNCRTLFSVWRIFLQNVFGRFLRLAVPQSTYIPREPQCLSPPPNWYSPPPLPHVSLTGWGSPNSDDWRKGLALYLLCGLYKICEKYLKKVLRIVHDYRCIHPVLRKNHTCVIPVSNFRRRWPHDPGQYT